MALSSLAINNDATTNPGRSEAESEDSHRSEPFVLQVGERRFVTSVDTLASQSEYFAALFSGRWASNTGSSSKKIDADCFVDANGDTFEHILEFLRTGVRPLSYHIKKGHNYWLYAKVAEQARYFFIPTLIEWFDEKRYLKLVSERWTAKLHEEPFDAVISSRVALCPSRQFIFHLTTVTRKVYVCPQRFVSREGDYKWKYGQPCRTALQGDSDDKFEEREVLYMVAFEKTVTITDPVE